MSSSFIVSELKSMIKWKCWIAEKNRLINFVFVCRNETIEILKSFKLKMNEKRKFSTVDRWEISRRTERTLEMWKVGCCARINGSKWFPWRILFWSMQNESFIESRPIDWLWLRNITDRQALIPRSESINLRDKQTERTKRKRWCYPTFLFDLLWFLTETIHFFARIQPRKVSRTRIDRRNSFIQTKFSICLARPKEKFIVSIGLVLCRRIFLFLKEKNNNRTIRFSFRRRKSITEPFFRLSSWRFHRVCQLCRELSRSTRKTNGKTLFHRFDSWKNFDIRLVSSSTWPAELFWRSAVVWICFSARFFCFCWPWAALVFLLKKKFKDLSEWIYSNRNNSTMFFVRISKEKQRKLVIENELKDCFCCFVIDS